MSGAAPWASGSPVPCDAKVGCRPDAPTGIDNVGVRPPPCPLWNCPDPKSELPDTRIAWVLNGLDPMLGRAADASPLVEAFLSTESDRRPVEPIGPAAPPWLRFTRWPLRPAPPCDCTWTARPVASVAAPAAAMGDARPLGVKLVEVRRPATHTDAARPAFTRAAVLVAGPRGGSHVTSQNIGGGSDDRIRFPASTVGCRAWRPTRSLMGRRTTGPPWAPGAAPPAVPWRRGWRWRWLAAALLLLGWPDCTEEETEPDAVSTKSRAAEPGDAADRSTPPDSADPGPVTPEAAVPGSATPVAVASKDPAERPAVPPSSAVRGPGELPSVLPRTGAAGWSAKAALAAMGTASASSSSLYMLPRTTSSAAAPDADDIAESASRPRSGSHCTSGSSRLATAAAPEASRPGVRPPPEDVQRMPLPAIGISEAIAPSLPAAPVLSTSSPPPKMPSSSSSSMASSPSSAIDSASSASTGNPDSASPTTIIRRFVGARCTTIDSDGVASSSDPAPSCSDTRTGASHPPAVCTTDTCAPREKASPFSCGDRYARMAASYSDPSGSGKSDASDWPTRSDRPRPKSRAVATLASVISP
mmetsp:Transcript_17357/g.65704  ORF Transcript_17357/g.65704 Transcript_17357/m.65704 type:complete len:587 (-) Transcript_17357:399-2159(-)